MAGGFAAAPAWGEPVGAHYDPGAVSVSQAGTRTTVSQTSSRAVVDWDGFDVRAQESVAFNQPDSRSAILNRVHSTGASQIAGAITAPGQVIIQNANGVMFSATARVDVGALVATTLNVDRQQFLDSGRIALSGAANPLAGVSNAGTITAAEKGLVALVGSHVANSGVISARLGSVALAAGTAATIDFGGDGLVQFAITDPVTSGLTGAGALVANSGRISADGGSVLLTASAAAGLVSRAINLDGIIEARGVETHGGSVVLIGGAAGAVTLGNAARVDVSGPAGGAAVVTGDSVSLASGATIDASGSEGPGGLIRVGGDFRGLGSLAQANSTNVAAGTLLDVSSGSGDGGSIVVWSTGRTDFAGTALAEARGASGQGGLIETSSTGILTVHPEATVSTRGPAGYVGTWLLDPPSINIIEGPGTAGSPADANAAATASTISASTVVSALGGGNVRLQAEDLISVDAPVIAPVFTSTSGGLELVTSAQNGEIDVNAPILLQNRSLALRAGGDIRLGTNNPTTQVPEEQAIIAVGSGTVWLETRSTGRIVQAGNSAILATNLALIGGTVDVTSSDNFTLNLAGRALDGTFDFHETNASGTVSIGTVTDPFAAQSLTGVLQTVVHSLGSRDLIATFNPATDGTVSDTVFTLTAPGDVSFDTVVFSALPYTPPPDPALSDSSDHFISRIEYSIGANHYDLSPDTLSAAPAGFALEAEGGVVIAATSPYFLNRAWGVDGFVGIGGTHPEEIGYDPFNHVSEKLRVTLGGDTNQIQATYLLFFKNDFNIYTERANVEFFDTVTTVPNLTATQGMLVGTVQSETRLYGRPNPPFTFADPQPAFLPVDSFISSKLPVAYPLALPTITTEATELSPVDIYDLTISPPASPSGFVGDRYQQIFTPGTLTITPAPLDVASHNFTKVYGTPDPTFSFDVDGLQNNETIAAVMSGSQVRLDTSENVGHYDITRGDLTPNGNYYINNYTPGILAITPASLVIRADNDSRVYGDANPGWIASGQNEHFVSSGFVLGDTEALIASVDFATLAGPGSPVAHYDITPSNAVLTGVAATNYDVTYLPGTLAVTPAPLLVHALDEQRIYGEANPVFSFGTSGWRNGDEGSNSIEASPFTLADVTTGVGDHAIEVGPATFIGSAGGNYQIISQPGLLTILPAQLLVTADNQSRRYQEPNPPLTWTTTGWKNSDDLTTTVNASLSTTALQTSDVGDYPITVDSAVLSGAASANYTILTQPGTLVISAAQLLLVSADSFTRVYGTDNPVFTFQTAGWLGTDKDENSVSATLTSPATILSNVGNYVIAVSDPVITGPDALNYEIRTFDGQLTITPAPLLFAADNAERLYGDPNPALTYTTHGFRNQDAALYTTTANLSTTATQASDVGQAPITIADPNLIGPNPANYTIDTHPGVLTIDPAPLTVLAGFFSKLFGAVDPPFPLNVEGLRNNDTSAAVLSGSVLREPGENVGAYPIRQGTVGLTTNNYTLNFVDGALNITPAPLTVVASDQARIYGDQDPTFTFTVDGLQFADTVDSILTGNLGREAGENVGHYAIHEGELSLTSPNYTISFTPGTLSITPAPLTVTGDQHFKVFGDYDPTFTYTVDGLRLGDTPASILTGALGRVPGENVGDYPVIQGGLHLASPNYVMTYIDGNLRITPAPLTVTADSNQKVFGQPDPILTFTVEGLKHGDSPSDAVSGNVERQPGEEIGTFPIQQGTVQLINPNYAITFVDGIFRIIPMPDELGRLSARSFNPWHVERIVRGRDPDTPGDAVYRTTRYENPFIPDPLLRAYGLGGVLMGPNLIAPPVLRNDDWTRIDNDRTGQHADLPPTHQVVCAELPLNTIALCQMSGWFKNFWLGRGQ